MSPWRKRVVIGVSPQALQLAVLERGFSRRAVETRVYDVQADAARGWSAPLEVLADVLRRSTLRGTCVQVVLSNEFVRYQVVRWHAALTSGAQRLALATAQYRAVYGDQSGGWSVRVAAGRYREDSLACAFDTALLESLSGTLNAAGLQLGSLVPHACVAWNRARRELPASGFWFVVAEPGRLWLARAENGTLAAVAARRVQAYEDAARALEQEIAARDRGAAPAPVYVAGAAAPAFEGAHRIRSAHAPLDLGIDAARSAR